MKAPKFTQKKSILSMSCRVEVTIGASAQVVWDILTDAKGFPRWNSTVAGIEGKIAEGEHLRLHAPGTDRIFKPKVSEVVAPQCMTWSDGVAPLFRGVRTFVLKPNGDGSTDFSMEERFSGLVFAMVKGTLPDFRPIFEAYANDLQREAERIVQAQGSASA